MGESPLAYRSKDLQKLKRQRRPTVLENIIRESAKHKHVFHMDKKKNEGLQTLLKDAILMKVSSQALLYKKEQFYRNSGLNEIRQETH